MKIQLSRSSRNRKTGPIPVTMSEASTCWEGCAFFGQGCYAQTGHMRINWDAISDGTRGQPWSRVLDEIALLPDGQLWRHNQAGDLPGSGPAIDRALLNELVAANAGRRTGVRRRGRKAGFTYTHKPVLDHPEAPANRQAIKAAIEGGFMINLSADSPLHADQLADLAIAPVTSALPSAYARRHKKGAWLETIGQWRDRIAELPRFTPGGRRIAVCPATYSDTTTCSSCGACTLPRSAIIGFPAHGAQRVKADKAVQARS